jgi:hypothetical protein
VRTVKRKWGKKCWDVRGGGSSSIELNWLSEKKKRHVGIISNVCKDVRRAVCTVEKNDFFLSQ